MTERFILVVRDILEKKLPRSNGVSLRSWDEAQEIIGLSLAGSNETYMHQNILIGLVQHVAEALDKRTAEHFAQSEEK